MRGVREMLYLAGMKRLKQVREERGLTQEQLAVRAGIASATVSRLERGESGGMMAVLRVLATELRFTNEPERLLDDVPDPPDPSASSTAA